ncbi:MAG: substrate-binding domain-containing protein [Desulfobacteraceae bacterium]|nr:substrate-binding domain-containing protein [Desulfobacteraceae bacterium]
MKNIVKIIVTACIVSFLVIPAFSQSTPSLMMATTTSTDNTGLLEYLAPAFTSDTGIVLKWVATGTGKALKLGENCDVDVLMVHAPAAEKKFVADGFGVAKLKILVEGDDGLKNQYSVMAVDPGLCANVKYETALKFADWITSARAQQLIAEFKLLGKVLFIPNAK